MVGMIVLLHSMNTVLFNMIESFLDQASEDIFNGVKSKAARKCCPEKLWKTATRKLDRDWLSLHQSELESNWQKAVNGEPLGYIAPLE